MIIYLTTAVTNKAKRPTEDFAELFYLNMEEITNGKV